MLSKQMCFLAMFLLYCVFTLSSCGGGGGSANQTNDPVPGSPKIEATFQVNANEDVKKTVGNIQIEIPAHTFSQNATVTVGLSSPTTKPPNTNIKVIGKQIELSCSIPPLSDIFISTNSQSVRSQQLSASTLLSIPVYLFEGIWKIAGTVVQDKITLHPLWLTGKTLKFIVIQTEIIEPVDTGNIRPVLLAGSGVLGENSALLVHGINDRVEGMKLLGQELVTAGGYKNSWGLSYNWQLPTKDVASVLGEILDGVTIGNVDLIAHSRGVLVCRYAMEVLDKTSHVRRAILVCGPNLGSKFDTEMALLNGLREHFINTPDAYGIPLVDTPAVKELLSHSEVVQYLNTDHGQRGTATYQLIAANRDAFVSTDSAHCEGVDLESFTTGLVIRDVLSGDHTSLVKTPIGIASLIQKIQDRAIVTTISGPKSIDADPNDLYWEGTLKITNYSNSSVELQDLAIGSYDRHGEWVGCQWYDPACQPDAFLPTDYTKWNRSLAAKESITIDLCHWADTFETPIGQADERYRAWTVYFNLRYAQNNQKLSHLTSYILHCGSIYPDGAQINSRAISTSSVMSGGIGKISLK